MHKISTISKIVSEFFLVTTIGISCAGFAETSEISNGGLSQEKVQLRENEPCCGPINAGGRRVLEVLDHADVEHLWLPRQHVNWETGQPESSAPVYSSHCSAFAAAIGKRLNVYMLRPPEHSPVLLASAQTVWFGKDEGKRAGWYQLKTAREAQTLSNAGELVVVSYASPNPGKPGHIAIVRPSDKTAAALAEEGPEITQAGSKNYAASNVRTGFKHHADATPDGVRYFGHAVPQALSQ